MPASGPDLDAMRPRLDEALARWREAGLKAEGMIGDSDPVQAVDEICSPGRFDEVIVSTLPGQTSRWLRSDVPYRIGAMTDLPVTHVVAMSMQKPTLRGEPLRAPRARAARDAQRDVVPRSAPAAVAQPAVNSSRLPHGSLA